MRSGRVTGIAALPIVGGVFLGIGIVGLGIAGALAAVEMASGRNVRADGIVVSAGYGRPRVRFTLPDGRDVEFREPIRNTSWETGNHAAVAYEPSHPEQARVDGIGGRWFATFLAGILGGIFALVGTSLTVAGRVAVRPAP